MKFKFVELMTEKELLDTKTHLELIRKLNEKNELMRIAEKEVEKKK